MAINTMKDLELFIRTEHLTSDRLIQALVNKRVIVAPKVARMILSKVNYRAC